MSLPWCEKCKQKQSKPGYINTQCLACKWQYVGQEAFDRKADLFTDNPDDAEHKAPHEFFGKSIEYAGVEVI